MKVVGFLLKNIWYKGGILFFYFYYYVFVCIGIDDSWCIIYIMGILDLIMNMKI